MTLDENDFLTYQLFTASKSPRIRRTRKRSWILLTITFGLCSYSFYLGGNTAVEVYFLILSLATLFLYPFYSRWRYKNHYLKHIRDVYKNRFGETSELEFNDDTIITKDKNTEAKINKSELERIDEIQDYYFIKTRSGTSLIISKKKTDDLEKIKLEINSLADKLGIPYVVDLNWKWK